MKRKIFLSIISALLPFVLLPLAKSSYQELQCAYVMIIMAVYCILETTPIGVVGMLPMVLFPILGIISSTEVCKNYMTEGIVAFIGGVMAALAVEDCKLHERIALKVLLLIGTEIKFLLLGIMLTTMFFSMWMSNTATTAMMIPIVNALVGEISSNATEVPLDKYNSTTNRIHAVSFEEKDKIRNNIKDTKKKSTSLRVTLLLGVCYAANIGGTGTLLGTPANMAFLGVVNSLYPGSDEITFASWMLYNVPGVFLCVISGWLNLWLFNIYFSKTKHNESKDEIYGIISKRYKQLGSISSHEISVIVLFSLLIVLWIFRDPKFIPGWYTDLGFKLKVGDSTTAIAILFLMFLLPSDFRDFNSPPILEWKTVQTKFPWSVIFIVGGGISLAQGVQASGLSNSIGSMLPALKILPPGMVVAITCLFIAMATEFLTKTPVVMIVLPIMNEMALSIGVNPLYLMLPSTVVASYGFMLPVAGLANALVFEEGNMKTMDMLKPGIAMNILCCCIHLFILHTIGIAMFDLNKFPSWASYKNVTEFEDLVINATKILKKYFGFIN